MKRACFEWVPPFKFPGDPKMPGPPYAVIPVKEPGFKSVLYWALVGNVSVKEGIQVADIIARIPFKTWAEALTAALNANQLPTSVNPRKS